MHAAKIHTRALARPMSNYAQWALEALRLCTCCLVSDERDFSHIVARISPWRFVSRYSEAFLGAPPPSSTTRHTTRLATPESILSRGGGSRNDVN